MARPSDDVANRALARWPEIKKKKKNKERKQNTRHQTDSNFNLFFVYSHDCTWACATARGSFVLRSDTTGVPCSVTVSCTPAN